MEGVRPRPGLPPEPTGPLVDGRGHTASLETRSPSFGRTAASLDPEAGRPSQFSKNRAAFPAAREKFAFFEDEEDTVSI
jgi:hypothetical protein